MKKLSSYFLFIYCAIASNVFAMDQNAIVESLAGDNYSYEDFVALSDKIEKYERYKEMPSQFLMNEFSNLPLPAKYLAYSISDILYDKSSYISHTNLKICLNFLKSQFPNPNREHKKLVMHFFVKLVSGKLSSVDKIIENIASKNIVDAATVFYVEFFSNDIAISSLQIKTLKNLLEVIQKRFPQPSPQEQEHIVRSIEEYLRGKQKLETILVAGETRTGKSALISFFIDPFDKEDHDATTRESIFSHTEFVSSRYACVQAANGTLRFIHFIDSPGFNEIKEMNGEEARSNEDISTIIADYLMQLKKENVVLDRIFIAAEFGKLPGIFVDEFMAKIRESKLFQGKFDLVVSRAKNEDEYQSCLSQFKKTDFVYRWNQKKYIGKFLRAGSVFNPVFDNGNIEGTLVVAADACRFRNEILATIFSAQFDEFIDNGKLTNEAELKLKALIPPREFVEMPFLLDLEDSSD